MRTRALLAAAAAMCLISSATATGQTLGAAATVDIKRFSGEPGTGVLDTISAGVVVSAGAPVTPRTSIQLEIALERPSTVTRVTEVQQGRLQTHYRNYMRTVSVLAAVHPLASRRLRASVLAGLTFVHMRRTVTLEPPPSNLGTTVQPPRSEFVDRIGAATVGAEVDVFVSQRLAVTPALRAHALRLASDLGGFSVRPSIGLKWTF
jgi:hypothetical protein